MSMIFRQLFHWDKKKALLFTIKNPMLRQVLLTTHCYFILNSCLVVNLKSEQIVYINLLANGKRKVVSIQGKVA